MGTFTQLQRTFEALNTDEIAENSLDKTKDAAVDAQRQQMFSGLTSEETRITNVFTGSDEYSPGYAKIKGKKGPIDLYDTGDFSGEIFADVRDDGLVFSSADEKTQKLEKQFGSNIFGLGGDYRQQYLDENLRPEFQKEIEQATGLKFKE